MSLEEMIDEILYTTICRNTEECAGKKCTECPIIVKAAKKELKRRKNEKIIHISSR